MDTKKLNRWAELLLDTGKRNNLINFKDTRASTVEVTKPDVYDLFAKIDGDTSFEVFDPKKFNLEQEIEDVDEEELLEDEQGDTSKKEKYISDCLSKMNKSNYVLLYNQFMDPVKALRNIDKKAKEYIEETGVNVAYMAFGFIHWTESEHSEYVYRAPVLLMPIELNQESSIDPYFIKSTGDDIVVNPTFAYKLNADYGIKLPEYNDEGFKEYLQKVEEIVKKLNWKVSNECKIGIFSFLKINMYRDLMDNANKILQNPNVRLLLGEKTDLDMDSNLSDECKVKDPLIELHSVVDADSSQIEAIEMAKSGKSFVLQGPPGTGKSQTITNIISECLGDGKKVLFVSEKLAALNVVSEKLKQAGLSEFCLELHSHKANKKNVISDICHTLHMSKCSVSEKANVEIEIKQKMQRQLDAYAVELHKERPMIGKSLYQLYELHSQHRNDPTIEWTVPNLPSKGEEYLREVTFLLEQYVNFIPSIGYDYKKNPWFGYTMQDTTYQTKDSVKKAFASTKEFLMNIKPICSEISGKYNASIQNISEVYHWNVLLKILSNTDFVTPSMLDTKNFQSISLAMKSLASCSKEALNIQSDINEQYDKEIYAINGNEYNKKLKVQFSGTFSRLFNSEYKSMITNLRMCMKSDSKLSYDGALAITEKLANYRSKVEEFNALEEPVKQYFGSGYKGICSDWDSFTQQVESLDPAIHGIQSFGVLKEYSDFSNHEEFQLYFDQLSSVIESYSTETLGFISGCFNKLIFNMEEVALEESLEKCNSCLNDMERLDNWCHFRTLLSDLNQYQALPYVNLIIERNLESIHIVGSFQKLFYYQWIDSIIAGSSILSLFNRILQDNTVKIFAEKDKEQFEINKVKIRSELSKQRPSIDLISNGSALSILLREGEKKRKQKSIRTLLQETGELVQRVKPCFLMSPLSVSTFLGSDSITFDVVVFDEASQIFPQDAIGAIYRAKQVIVVGDSKQMPPSNFFNSTIDVEDNDEETGDVTDFESILDLCSACMRQLRLRWHYRSRYEQLITFSNKNYYDNDLVTFPSSKGDTKGNGVDYYPVDGIFDRKSHTNRKEAEFIVDLIYENIDKYPERSLGVVAFSVAQQELIDTLLSKRRQETPEKEYFFDKSKNEYFFIKNLETVQGDERDTIIFSVAYGKDAQGRLLHNFGPLNRVGGERRLNVAITRAKYNVQLVSSMHYTDIDLKRTSAEGARLLREYLDYAENGELFLEREMKLNSFEQFDSEFELEVCEFLRSKGFSVDTQVGCSGFRIDLGLKRPESSDYVLAIECDGATYHSSKNARDRDRLRQEILERMGWKFYRIWSTDWFRNKEVEKERLLEAVKDALNGNGDSHDEHLIEDKSNVKVNNFEEVKKEENFEFPEYKEADIYSLSYQYLPNDFQGFIKAILDVESPLSEELLLRRIVSCFDREKVTSVVQKEYLQNMMGCTRNRIFRRNGFLYLMDGKEIKFRKPGSLKREIKQIAPEELANLMITFLKENITVEKAGLYKSVAHECGFNRLGKTINEHLDKALLVLKDKISIDEEMIKLK